MSVEKISRLNDLEFESKIIDVLGIDNLDKIDIAKENNNKLAGKSDVRMAIEMGLADKDVLLAALVEDTKTRINIIKAEKGDVLKGYVVDFIAEKYGPDEDVIAKRDKNITRQEAAVMAVDAGQLLLMLGSDLNTQGGNKWNEITMRAFHSGISASEQLANAILSEDPKRYPIEQAEGWKTKLKGSLRLFATKTTELSEIEEFITQRIDGDITHGVELAKQFQAKQKSGPRPGGPG